MNILLFVSTLIMAMALLTYARLDSYRSFSVLQNEFKYYMAITERGAINKLAEKMYKDNRATKKGANDPKEKNAQRSNAKSLLSIATLVDSKKRSIDGARHHQWMAILKKLMVILYKDQPFYIEIEQKKPDFIDLLLASMMQAIDNLSDKHKIKKTKDLANLKLSDPDLNYALFSIVQETSDRSEIKASASSHPVCSPSEGGEEEEEDNEEEDEEEEGNGGEEVYSAEGRYSLLDFITLEGPEKIRVYLAPRELLLAVFESPDVVNDIVKTRERLYDQVIKETLSPKEATEQFKAQFLPLSNEAIVDFTVTKTNPKNK